MTQEERRRVVEALAETHRLLDREIGNQSHVRKPHPTWKRERQDQIKFYKAHIRKLEAMLCGKSVPMWTKVEG